MNNVSRLFLPVVSFITVFLWWSAASAAIFTVTNTADAGPGSLRDAIIQANSNGTSDTIDFSLPAAGIQTIRPLSQLPLLSDPAGVLIDGLSQPGANAGANPPSTAMLTIELNGAAAGASHGIWIVSPNNTVRGVVIDSFEQDGIRIQGVPAGTFNNHIFCTIIGMDPSGMLVWGNGRNRTSYWAGVNIIVTPETVGFAFDNRVERNLISGNYAEGVGISNCPPGDVYQNIVRGNYLGTDITGTIDNGNVHDGVYIGEGAHDNIVDSNTISGNDFEGVCIVGYAANSIFTNRNTVSDNTIGLDVNGAALPNTMNGVSIGKYGNLYSGGFACANVVGPNNTIAANGRSGVMVWEHSSTPANADSNTITRNLIFRSGLLGIDLGDDTVTLNDAGDPDAGANQQCNFPVIASAQYSGGQTTISGTLDVTGSPAAAAIELYAVRSPSSYNYGEGDYFLGSTAPDALGNWSVTVTDTMANLGKTVTATATDAGRNTSEFALNVVVIAPSAVTNGKETGFSPGRYRVRHVNGRWLFEIAVETSTREAAVAIYTVSGRLIRLLENGVRSGALCRFTWDGTGSGGIKVPPGIYLFTINAGTFDTKGTVTLR